MADLAKVRKSIKSLKHGSLKAKDLKPRTYFGLFYKTFQFLLNCFLTHCRIDSFQILRLIVLALSHNLSAEKSKLSVESGIKGLLLLECMLSRQSQVQPGTLYSQVQPCKAGYSQVPPGTVLKRPIMTTWRPLGST